MRSNFFLFTNYYLSVLTAFLGFQMIYLYRHYDDDQAARVLLFLIVLFAIPTLTSWISYALKSSFGATLTAIMFIYPVVSFSKFISYQSQGSVGDRVLSTVLFFLFALSTLVPLLISASEQRKLNRKWEKV